MSKGASLSQKGLLIVLLPVLLSTVLIGSLKVVIEYTRQEARAEAKSQALAAAAQQMFDITFHGVVAFHLFQITKQRSFERAGDRAVERIHDQIRLLRSMVTPGSPQARHVDRIEQLTDDTIVMLKEPFEIMDEGTTASVVPAMRKELFIEINKVTKEITLLLAEESANASQIGLRAESYRKLMDNFLVAGIGANILLAAALAMLFSRQITGRLSVLMDNITRLAQDKPLNEVVKGNDEITALDNSFHEMTKELSAARRKEKAVFETLPLGIVTLKDDQTIESVNSATRTLLARADSEIIGKNLDEFLRADKRPDAVSPNLHTELLSKTTECFASRGDDYVPIETRGTELLPEQKSGYLLVLTDLTERYEIEQLKQGFIAMISHELRSPLASITVCLKLLLRGVYGPLDESGQTSVNDSLLSANRIIGLINEILDAERVNSGQLTVDPKPSELSAVVGSAVRTMSMVASEKEIKIEVEAPMHEMAFDPNRIEQVIINFLSNAIKFSPNATTIRVHAEVRADDVKLSVTDHGRGIPADARQLVFKKFYQVRKEDSALKGAGIGLSICKAIIDAHKGDIGITEGADGGSCFWFTLPIVQPDGIGHE